MSPLTKVMALLVSVLSIFLCGLVLVYVTNTEHYRQMYEDQKALAQGVTDSAREAQNLAQATEQRYQDIIKRQNATIKSYEQLNADWVDQWKTERMARLEAQKESQNAVELSLSLSETLDNLQTTQVFIQNKLAEAEQSKLRAESKVIGLEEELNQQLAEVESLKTDRRQNLELIQKLESENEQLRQGGGLRSREVRPGVDRVTNVEVGQTRTPIRGKILAVKGTLASISIGESSGVAKGQEFNVLRSLGEGQIKFMGKLTITYVEPEEAVGQISQQTGVILTGDTVSTEYR